MNPFEQTQLMLAVWRRLGVDRADLAVLRKSGAMVRHLDVPLEELPLPWARAENLARAEVYVRPARGRPWPLVFLDDVQTTMAVRVARKYSALVVETSLEGCCHLWLAAANPLTEKERAQAQRWLAQRIGADRASISGEHLGRLAGLKNWKRDGQWVNVLDAPSPTDHPWDPRPTLLSSPHSLTRPESTAVPKVRVGRDTSESGREWGWVCHRLESGCDPEQVFLALLDRCRDRRGRDAERYARRTVSRALEHCRLPANPLPTRLRA